MYVWKLTHVCLFRWCSSISVTPWEVHFCGQILYWKKRVRQRTKSNFKFKIAISPELIPYISEDKLP